MSRRVFALLMVLLSGMVVTPALADLRVLLSFDAAGTHVSKVFRVDEFVSLGQSADLQGRTMARQSRDAVLIWQDADGDVLRVSREADPRVVRGPAHVNAASASIGSLSDGAWLVDGPEEAHSLIVELPERSDLALAAENWTLWLTIDE